MRVTGQPVIGRMANATLALDAVTEVPQRRRPDHLD
jgi:hypothetical protein